MITAVIHVSTSATVYLHRSDAAVLADIRDQIGAVLVARRHNRPTAHLARGAVRLVGAALDASPGIDYDATQL